MIFLFRRRFFFISVLLVNVVLWGILCFAVAPAVRANTAVEPIIQPSNFAVPAIYYGFITPTVGFAPAVGMSITAEISGTLCGSTTVQDTDGQLSYVIQVAGDDSAQLNNGCGDPGDLVSFRLDGDLLPQVVAWDSDQLNPLSFDQAFDQAIDITVSGGNVQLVWPDHTAVCGYHIYERPDTPFYTPAAGDLVGTGTSFVAPAETGTHFYKVVTDDCNGTTRELVAVGTFSFEVETGS